ncbi:ParB N-terminal domain-containing protein [Paraburkholderia aspalathi]|uniref:ParB N-terminal domain-containing protein n=1 Tax=Paraburkholderia aspalathi TaxID=1324617 RepID=UPI0038BA4135
MTKKTIEGRLITVPLSQLHISPLNARANDTSDVTELAALLDSQGQLQNLIVIPEDGDKGVVGGGRRYRAFKLLEQKGKLPGDHPIFCLLTTPALALAASVAENTGRKEMHPADEFYAFKVLFEEGTPVEDIAAQFGCTPLVVQRRLSLSKVSPMLVELYRKGEMKLEDLQAFTLVDDHALQCKVWADAPHYYRNAHHLRQALTKGKTDASRERVAQFVGLAAYEAAGGHVLRDLFGGPDSGYVGDMALMQKLASEKLEAAADKLRAEGWSFVEVLPEIGYSETSRYGRSKPKVRALTTEEKTEIASLEEIANAASEAMEADSEDQLTDGEIAEFEHKAERAVDLINTIKASLETFTDRQKKSAGAVLGLNHNGVLEIHRGMIDPKVAVAKEKAKEKAEREKRVAAGEAVEPEKATYSEVLLRKLTANRSAAMSAHLLEAPRVALDLLCSSLLAKVLHTGYYGSSGLAIVPTEQLTNLTSSADDMEEGKAWAALTERRTQLLAELPEDPDAIFSYVASRSAVDVIELLAFCTAACINTTTSNDHSRPLEHVEQTIGLNMADWWQPTRKSYLGQVAKPVIIQALEEVGIGELAIKQADKLKKGELAQKAEELLTDTGWLPALLRPMTPPAAKVPKAKVTPKARAKKESKSEQPAEVPMSTTPAKGKRAVPLHPAMGTRTEPLNPAAAWPFPTTRP